MILAQGHGYRLAGHRRGRHLRVPPQGNRPAERWDTFTFSMADAKRANLLGKKTTGRCTRA